MLRNALKTLLPQKSGATPETLRIVGGKDVAPPSPAPAAEEWASSVKTGIGDLRNGFSRLGLLTAGAFIVWATVFPLSSAVIGHGYIVPSGQTKLLQHRMGGTVRAILKREGDRIAANGIVAELDPTVNQGELGRLRGRRDTLLALKTRLEAENRFASAVDNAASAGLRLKMVGETAGSLWHQDSNVLPANLIDEQEREYNRGRAAMVSELQALEERAQGVARQQEGTQARLAQVNLQVGILARQEAAATKLAAAGHLSQQQKWDIQTRLAEKRGEQATLASQIQSLRSQYEEIRAQMRQAQNRDGRQTSERLTDVIGELEQITDQLRAAEAEVRNTALRAPVAGTIIKMANATIGGVLKPGDVFAEIVPDGAPLEMQVRVQPQDIMGVQVGQDADIKVTSLNNRLFDKLKGKVVYRAADSTLDQRTGERYFEVRIQIASVERRGGNEFHLGAGMTGDAFIIGESRTFASYLLRPLFDSFGRAFSERH